jgi:peptide-methionine (S)-S-oxide reductase
MQHFLSQHPLNAPYPEGFDTAIFGLGCFWGAERKFWQVTGVYVTAVGYCGGLTQNPTYEQVCTGKTHHNEVVLVVYDPKIVSYKQLLKVFFESHNPTQGNRQGNDIGTQYRSGLYYFNESQRDDAHAGKKIYQESLLAAGFPPLTTEILKAEAFYFAEPYHQQYLAKNPNGYCGLGGTGINCTL